MADRHGVPVDVVREASQRPVTGIGRRAILGGAVAAAGLLALGKGARAAPQGARKVAIVGGGMAGMACAGLLDKRGVTFKVFEGSGRLGGRMFSNRTGYWDNNQVSEWGGELIDTNHATMQRLAARYGLILDDLFASQPAGSEEVYRVGGSYYPKPDADKDFRAMWDRVTADIRAASYPTTYNGFTEAGRTLDRMSVHDWIRTRVPGGHGSQLGKVLDVAYAIEYGADTADQSALNLLYLLAYQPKPLAFASFGVSDERYHIRGGNQQLPEAIAASLPAGTVKHGHMLEQVARTTAGRVRLTFETAAGTVEETFDHVILCIPFAMLATVDTAQAGFDPLKLRVINELGRGHNGKLQLQFATRIWAGTGAWPGVANGSTFAGTGYQCSWESTRGQPGATGILNLYSGGSVTDTMRSNVPFATHTNSQARRDAVTGLGQISSVFPGLQWNGKLTQSLWHNNPYSLHSYAYYRVGQYTAFGGHEGVRQNNISFANDGCSQDFQGFMEGAASEGERAAKEVLALL